MHEGEGMKIEGAVEEVLNLPTVISLKVVTESVLSITIIDNLYPKPRFSVVPQNRFDRR